jgi:hypothetical protein
MSKNKKVMSIAIVPDLHEELKRYAKRKGLSASSYVGDLIDQAVKLNIDDDPMVIGKPIDEEVTVLTIPVDESVSPVVLKIPVALKSDPEQLRKWMAVQMGGILKAIAKKNESLVE